MIKIISLFILIYSFVPVIAQTITGPSGLFTIPTAEILKDGTVAIGANYLNKKFVEYNNHENDILIGGVSVTYLPFFEITIRATRKLNVPKHENHVMDRFIAFKLKIINEKKYLPAIVFGMNNPISTEVGASHFNSTYLVLSKNLAPHILFDNLSLSIGYGSDIIGANDHQFIGLFGGASFDLYFSSSRKSYISLLLEYDADRINGGLKLRLFDHISFLAGFMGLERFSGGVSLSLSI